MIIIRITKLLLFMYFYNTPNSSLNWEIDLIVIPYCTAFLYLEPVLYPSVGTIKRSVSLVTEPSPASYPFTC